MSLRLPAKFSWKTILLTLTCFLELNASSISESYEPNRPVGLLSVFPIMDSQHNGEGTGRQELLVIISDAAVIIVLAIIEETVRSSKRKSSANLRAIVCKVTYRIS